MVGDWVFCELRLWVIESVFSAKTFVGAEGDVTVDGLHGRMPCVDGIVEILIVYRTIIEYQFLVGCENVGR